MAKKGGYKIIDFKNVSLKSDGTITKIPGVFESIEENYNKPCLITGFKVGDTEWGDFFVTFIPSGDTVFNAHFLYTGQTVFTLNVIYNVGVSINQTQLTPVE